MLPKMRRLGEFEDATAPAPVVNLVLQPAFKEFKPLDQSAEFSRR
jgi:hypothetical protein